MEHIDCCLEESHRAMADEADREREALDWSEALIDTISDDGQ